MKSVKELYQQVTFEEAVELLEKDISNAVRSKKPTSVFVSSYTNVSLNDNLFQIFMLEENKEKTKNLFKTMKSLGYTISHSGHSIKINFTNFSPLELKEAELKFVDQVNEDSGSDPAFLNNLLDTNVIPKIINSIKENSNDWVLSRESSSETYKLESLTIEQSRITIKYDFRDSEVCTLSFLSSGSSRKENFLILSKGEVKKFREIFAQLIYDFNIRFNDAITQHLNQLNKR